MLTINDFLVALEKYAPLSLSAKMIERGSYDNSGVIIKNNEQVNSVLFSLDLSCETVLAAINMGSDTIVTHHPAIYSPIKNLDITGETAEVLSAARSGINVISFHLNLDVADGGIDQELAKVLGAKDEKIIEKIDDNCGYGREFSCLCDTSEIVSKIKVNLSTDKVLCYGEGKVKKIASFCGAGSSSALDYVVKEKDVADLIVTSDIPHHVLKELIERDKKVILIPHYVAENYGFNKFYERVKELLKGQIQAYYFEDKRFK